MFKTKCTECTSATCTDNRILKLLTDWLQGQSLLHLAVSRNSPDIVEALLKHGVDVNMLDFMVSGQNGCEGAELLYIHITSHCGCCGGTHCFIWLQKL